MENTFIIEELQSITPEDGHSIRSLTAQLGDDFQELTDKDLSDIVTSQSTHLYVARSEDNNTIIGMTTLIVYRIPFKMKGWIEDVVVDTEHRGKGVATKLMEHVIQEAERLEVKSLNLTSNPKRESAHKLYEQFGFVKRDTNVFRLSL